MHELDLWPFLMDKMFYYRRVVWVLSRFTDATNQICNSCKNLTCTKVFWSSTYVFMSSDNIVMCDCITVRFKHTIKTFSFTVESFFVRSEHLVTHHGDMPALRSHQSTNCANSEWLTEEPVINTEWILKSTYTETEWETMTAGSLIINRWLTGVVKWGWNVIITWMWQNTRFVLNYYSLHFSS